jgi:hypothetical protein
MLVFVVEYLLKHVYQVQSSMKNARRLKSVLKLGAAASSAVPKKNGAPVSAVTVLGMSGTAQKQE